MNKKDLVIVALATFCLTSTLFMILPSRSAERDPWADTSGPTVGKPDGTINMRDINYEIQHFNQDVSNMTRDVNVTNWLPPEPTTVRCGDYHVSSSGINNIYSAGFIKVEDYERMTVIMTFDNCTWPDAQDNSFSAVASWSISSSGPAFENDQLTSTLYQIVNLATNFNNTIVNTISMDCYPIRAPYVSVALDAIGSYMNSYGNADISVYIYLSNGPTTGSLHKTMTWQDTIYGTFSGTHYYFDMYELQGFNQVTLYMDSNVTNTVSVLGDTFSFSGSIAKTYTLNGRSLWVIVTPSTKPLLLYLNYYVTT